MKKFIALIFCICVASASFGLSETTRAPGPVAADYANFSNPLKKIGGWFKHIFTKKKKTVAYDNTPADVIDLVVSQPKTSYYYVDDQNFISDTSGMLEVTTEANDPENDTLVYGYEISGGRLIGQGSKVLWDLSGVEPGWYIITAGVDDGCGYCGRTFTKQIVVVETGGRKNPVICPSVVINANADPVKPGELIAFHATVEHPENFAQDIVWSVSSGDIVSGQNTDTLFVLAPADAEKNILTASLSLKGDTAGCKYSAIGEVRNY